MSIQDSVKINKILEVMSAAQKKLLEADEIITSQYNQHSDKKLFSALLKIGKANNNISSYTKHLKNIIKTMEKRNVSPT